MFRNLTYRQKLKYLGIGAILILFVSYQLSISKTIQQYKTYKQYNTASLTNNADETSLYLLQTKNKTLDEILNSFILDTLDQSKNLLGVVSEFCAANNLKVKEYKPHIPIQSDSIMTVTRSATVEGSFLNCLRLLHFLETQSSVGRVGSVLFKSYTNPGNNKTFLNCTIFIQNLIPTDK